VVATEVGGLMTTVLWLPANTASRPRSASTKPPSASKPVNGCG